MNQKTVHERYHSKTRKQIKIIKDNNFTYRILIGILNKKIRGSNKKILDVGCGAGTLSLYLANKGHEVLGIDISSRAIRECLKSREKLGLTTVNFKQFDFPNKYPKDRFDIVIFTEVIEHLEYDKKSLKTINSLLKPNGLMILTTPSNSAPLHKLGLTKEFDKKVGHLRRYSLDEIKKMVTNEGFKITEVQAAEGILRNFLFVNPIAGKSIRFIKYFLSDIVTFVDNATLRLFGYSNIIIIAKRG